VGRSELKGTMDKPGGVSGNNKNNERTSGGVTTNKTNNNNEHSVGIHRCKNYNHEWLLGGFSSTMSNNSINHTEVSPVGLQQRSNGGVSRTKQMHGGVPCINITTSTRLVSPVRLQECAEGSSAPTTTTTTTNARRGLRHR
jgi:hypothetical protein